MDGDFRIGPWLIKPQLNGVSCDGSNVQLEPKVMGVLVCLARHAPHPVSKDDLLREVWPHTFVGEGVLTRSISELRRVLNDEAKEPRIIQTIAKRGYRLIAQVTNVEGDSGQQPHRFRSLVVLPLENLSRDPEQEYFAEGLTEALITTLAKIGELRVVSRTSSILYKGARKSMREIARELDVDVVVQGTVLRVGDRVRITAQLIDPINESHVWAESYDRYLGHILDLQSEVTQAIARQIQVNLTPVEKSHLAELKTVDPDAYVAYLKGRHHWNRRSGDAIPKGAQCFREAIERDPTYAAAYSGLADCLSALGIYSFVSPDQGCARAKEAALRAVEIDPGSGEAHASLAWALHWGDYDFSRVEREFARAIELNPRYATAHQWFGLYLAQMGRYEEGYNELQLAMRLEPCSSPMYWASGLACWCSRRYDLAIEQFEKVLEFDSTFAQAYFGLAMTYPYKSMHAQAISAAKRALDQTNGTVFFLACAGETYAAAGCLDEAQKILERVNEISTKQYVTPYFIARIHAALGNRYEALNYLEKGYRFLDPHMVWLKTEPRLDDLRAEPRFQSLMRQMNFPP